MSRLIGKTLPVQRALKVAMLSMVIAGGRGICAAEEACRSAANRPAAIFGNSIIICDSPSVNRSGDISNPPVPTVVEESGEAVVSSVMWPESPTAPEPTQPAANPVLSSEHRKRDASLSGKVDDLFKSMAAAQRENRASQKRADARHERQQEQARTLSGSVDARLEVVVADVQQMLQTTQNAKTAEAASHSERVIRPSRLEAEKRPAVTTKDGKTDLPLLQINRTAEGRIPNNAYFVVGGLIAGIVAMCWYVSRSIRGPVNKVAGALEGVGSDVKKVLYATEGSEIATPQAHESRQERTKPKRTPFSRKAKKQPWRSDSIDPTRRVASADAQAMLRAMRDTRHATPHAKEVKLEWAKVDHPDMEIGSGAADPPVKTRTAPLNAIKGVEFQGARTMVDLTAFGA